LGERRNRRVLALVKHPQMGCRFGATVQPLGLGPKSDSEDDRRVLGGADPAQRIGHRLGAQGGVQLTCVRSGGPAWSETMRRQIGLGRCQPTGPDLILTPGPVLQQIDGNGVNGPAEQRGTADRTL
jgi:hypothetical protein